jgi:hypothetical protein
MASILHGRILHSLLAATHGLAFWLGKFLAAAHVVLESFPMPFKVNFSFFEYLFIIINYLLFCCTVCSRREIGIA